MIKKGVNKIKTPIEELQIMAGFKDSAQYVVLKKWIKRYVDNMKNVSFRLLEHESTFPYRHAEYAGQAIGLQNLLKFIDDIGKEIEKMESRE